jgi:redox-sensitive bicupin YhaK (pirin superfamily)
MMNTQTHTTGRATRKAIETRYAAQATTDGDGVNIQRIAPNMRAGTLDPFLLLDELKADEANADIGGFPRHPHRGFETVTYMLEGSISHRDTMGNSGVIEPGGIQWMTAGRGIEHSETPEQNGGRFHGFQLWVNLPAESKFIDPVYREIKADQIPSVTSANSMVKVLAGQYEQAIGPIQNNHAQASYFDVRLADGAEFSWQAPPGDTVLIYVYEGTVEIVGEPLVQQQMAKLVRSTDAENLAIKATDAGARFLLISGQPFKQPVVNYGPFVMTTSEQIEQALKDMQLKVLTKRTSEQEVLY